MNADPPVFPQPKLVSLFEPFGERAQGIAQSLAGIHALTCKALDSVDRRMAAVRDVQKAWGDLDGYAEQYKGSILELAREDVDIQNMGAQSLAKCLIALDELAHRSGADEIRRREAQTQALELCLSHLPERTRASWRSFCEKAAIAAATDRARAENSPKETPRL